VAQWLWWGLKQYQDSHADVVKHTTTGACVYLPNRRAVTAPQPDLALYRSFPLHRPICEIGWEDLSPALVAEVLSEADPDKDLVRNVALYLEVPSIKEYWVLDAREDADEPRMTVYRRRRGRAWRRIEVGPGERYTTRLLPGFELVLDTRS
jgi:Uma2 family endonuclease